MHVCVFCLQLGDQAPCQEPGEGDRAIQPRCLRCGDQGVKWYKLLPGDVIAAEKEALQAGQTFHLRLERERKRERTE